MRELLKVFEAVALAQVVKAVAIIVLVLGLCVVLFSGGASVDLSIKIGGENEYNTWAH